MGRARRCDKQINSQCQVARCALKKKTNRRWWRFERFWLSYDPEVGTGVLHDSVPSQQNLNDTRETCPTKIMGERVF